MIEGGGFEAITQLFVIHYIMNQVRISAGLDYLPKPCDFFDMMSGTGFGG